LHCLRILVPQRPGKGGAGLPNPSRKISGRAVFPSNQSLKMFAALGPRRTSCRFDCLCQNLRNVRAVETLSGQKLFRFVLFHFVSICLPF
jgi:hypothetical protein